LSATIAAERSRLPLAPLGQRYIDIAMRHPRRARLLEPVDVRRADRREFLCKLDPTTMTGCFGAPNSIVFGDLGSRSESGHAAHEIAH
jgi:hypothetical protein